MVTHFDSILFSLSAPVLLILINSNESSYFYPFFFLMLLDTSFNFTNTKVMIALNLECFSHVHLVIYKQKKNLLINSLFRLLRFYLTETVAICFSNPY